VAGFGTTPISGIEFAGLGVGNTSLRYLRSVPRLRRLVERFRPDVVNAHFISSYGVAAALARGDTPLVLSAWGSDVLWLPRRAPWHRRLVIRALRRADMVTFDSDDVASVVAKLAPHTRRARVRFGPEHRWSVAPRDEQPIVLSPRRPEPFYNVERIIEAFARAAAERQEWLLEVFTYGMACEGLRERVTALGLDQRVTFAPELTRDALRERFLRAAIFCSIPSSDALSASLLEGMAAGSFPIASDLPANHEWITSGSNGLLVDGRDVASVTTALELAMSDADLRSRARSENRGLIASTASWDHEMDRLMQQLEQLTAVTPSVA